MHVCKRKDDYCRDANGIIEVGNADDLYTQNCQTQDCPPSSSSTIQKHLKDKSANHSLVIIK